MKNEYGIACLLNNDSIKSLEHIPFLEKENIPHVSLFQFRCEDDNFISFMRENIKQLTLSNQFETTNISQEGNNIFLNITDDSTLQKSSDQIAETYFKNCHSKEFLSQINFSELTYAQKELVKKYGIYWIKQFYQPHVTLLYEQKLDSLPDLQIPKFLTVQPPDIYKIDGKGRIYSPA
jgi:hypothetical protein